MNMNSKNTTATITAENIASESYYNILVICDMTKYANPIAAFKATNETLDVIKDECGNIVGR